MEILKQIMVLYSEINNIYLELYNLELVGKKSSDMFLNMVRVLKEKLVEEERLFKLLYDSCEYNDVCNYIEKEDNPMFIRLRDYVTLYENLNIEIYEDDDEETVSELQIKIKASKMYSSCNKNIFLIYASFLQECIDSDGILREKLLSMKYYNAFTKHDMESSLIDYNFSIEMVNYVDLYLVARMLDLKLKLRDEIILDSCFSTIINMITLLLSINDDDRHNEEKAALSLNAECLIRACLSLLSDRDYKKIRKKIYEKIDELSNDKNMISLNIINSYIDNRMKDKARVRKLSSGVIPE